LGEIETALQRHAGLSEAVVLARADDAGEQRLVAYVVAAEGAAELTMSELRSFLGEKLPHYMIPGALVQMPAMPLTPNGKVDRRALPEPDQNRPDLSSVYVAPQTELEQIIAGIWQDVLKLEKVGVHDGFFDLGGHSLLMAQAHGLMRDALSKDISMIDLFKYPTISALAKYLDEDQSAIEQQSEIAISGSLAGDERAELRRESKKRQRQSGRKRQELRKKQETQNEEARIA